MSFGIEVLLISVAIGCDCVLPSLTVRKRHYNLKKLKSVSWYKKSNEASFCFRIVKTNENQTVEQIVIHFGRLQSHYHLDPVCLHFVYCPDFLRYQVTDLVTEFCLGTVNTYSHLLGTLRITPSSFGTVIVILA